MLVKGRKIAGREEMLPHYYAFDPREDEAIIKHRLLTRTTTTRGEPPLKKLQKRFNSFALELEKDTDNFCDCERLYKAFLQEMATFEVPLLKSKAVIDANLREKENFNERQEDIRRQILQAQADIEDLKKQLEESKIERQLWRTRLLLGQGRWSSGKNSSHFCCMWWLNLQNTIEDQKNLAEEQRITMKEPKNSIEDASCTSEAMAID